MSVPFNAGPLPEQGEPLNSEACSQADAVLLIHSTDAPVASGIGGWLQQLKVFCLPPAAPHAVPMLDLLVQDLRGRVVQHLEPAVSIHRLSLPAGSYLVTARLGKTRRGYYLTLAPGIEFDLFLDMGL